MTKKATSRRDSKGKLLPGSVINPTGKGGFRDNPEFINRKGPFPNAISIHYWLKTFQAMNKNEFDLWEENTPDEVKTMQALMAYKRIKNSVENLREFQEVANRTEGTPQQSMDITTQGEKINEFSDEQANRIAERIANR